MTHEEFHIGLHFFVNYPWKEWVCTDVGTRTIVAVNLDRSYMDESWLDGPPYAILEQVFDEDDMPSCTIEPPEIDED